MSVWDYIYDPALLGSAIADWLGGFLASWAMYLVMGVLGVVGVFVILMPCLLAVLWIERKLIARLQVRYGPNRAGRFGLLQPIADAIKLLAKEAFEPVAVDRVAYMLAPIIAFVPALLVFAVFPFGPGLVFADLNIGVLYIIAVGTLSTISAFMAGWSSNNKYSLLGAMRAVAQMVSYEIPLVLSVLGVVMFAGSLQMSHIVEAQLSRNVWFVLLQPLGFLVFFIASISEINRTPMDIVEAESEIIAGFHTEYSGMKFALFFVAEYTHAVAASAIIAILFFGGWGSAPFLDLIPPYVWFVAKIFFFFCVMVWIRGTLPRMRVDQLMSFAWKFLLPVSLVNLFVVGIEILLWDEAVMAPQLVIPTLVVINFVVCGLLIVVWSRIFGPKGVTA
jgi:NADH-quinone oxidoreductase subunit H